MQQAEPAQTVMFDSQPSSGLGAAGKEQLPQPAWHVDLQSPAVHSSVVVLAELHPRQPPQSVVVVSSVLHPSAGLPEQFA